MTMPYARIQSTSLVHAASDGKHRPASHPVLAGTPARFDESRTALIGWRIAAERIKRGWSQPALADRIGVSRTALAQWEAGTYRPSAEHAARLRELLG